MVAVAALLVAGLALHDHVGVLEWLFGTALLCTLGLMVWLGTRAALQAVAERRRASSLAKQEPSEVSLTAVREERRRLSGDIVACLQQALEAVVAEVSASLVAPDPGPGLRRIRHHMQVAASELRRQLGLLRAADAAAEDAEPQGRHLDVAMPAPADLLVGLIAVGVAVVEWVSYSWMEGVVLPPASLVLTVVAAGTIVGRRRAPAIAAALCGMVFLVALLLGAPVQGGFWSLITVGGLLWSVIARAESSYRQVSAGAFLVISSSLHMWLLSPDNFVFWVVTLGVFSCAAVASRLARRTATDSRTMADARDAELRLAASVAVTAERHTFARELHDVVSHAVGLIAVQSAAAEVAWPTNPAATSASLTLIRDTAQAALSELVSLTPLLPTRDRTMTDLLALVDRIRSAGTLVHLNTNLHPQDPLPAEAYRTAQEALTNVVRHAPEATATLSIVSDESQTVVEVNDNGQNEPASTRRGYGLVGLGERVALAGGVLESGPIAGGQGFRVTATIPNHVPASA